MIVAGIHGNYWSNRKSVITNYLFFPSSLCCQHCFLIGQRYFIEFCLCIFQSYLWLLNTINKEYRFANRTTVRIPLIFQ